MITRALIVVNLIAFVWEITVAGPGMLSAFGGGNILAVLNDGALWPAAVLQGHQWWRLITAGFLHGGLVHITVNMISLYSLGRFVEQVAGPVRMALIYVVSLIASSLCVVYFSPAMQPTLGASGAIFGLFGALFAIGLKLGKPGMDLVRANIGILILNLIITFSPGLNISWQAHIGGLFAGFILTLLVYFPPKRVAPVVRDASTGEGYETEYQTPRHR